MKYRWNNNIGHNIGDPIILDRLRNTFAQNHLRTYVHGILSSEHSFSADLPGKSLDLYLTVEENSLGESLTKWIETDQKKSYLSDMREAAMHIERTDGELDPIAQYELRIKALLQRLFGNYAMSLISFDTSTEVVISLSFEQTYDLEEVLDKFLAKQLDGSYLIQTLPEQLSH